MILSYTGKTLKEVKNLDEVEYTECLNIISDIHCEYLHLEIKDIVETLYENCELKSKVIIICGDISKSNEINFDFLREASDFWEKIIFIPGNHEYYNPVYEKQNRILDLYEKLTNSGFSEKIIL